MSPGEHVERYRIVRLLGTGGTARVYEAVHEFTSRTVALKVMHARFNRRPEVVERFRKEAVALSRIDHPNVVAIDNGGLTDDGLAFIAMEKLEGKTLRELLRERPRLPLAEALSILIQIAEGVAAAHASNVIHGALKPENIFCTDAGPVKVLDLGIAGLLDHDPTPRADAAADVLALGAVADECLRLSDVPAELSAVVRRATATDPEPRFTSMRELAEALRRVREAAAFEREPARPARSAAAGRSTRTKPRAAVVAGGALCALLLAAAALRWSSSERSERSALTPRIPEVAQLGRELIPPQPPSAPPSQPANATEKDASAPLVAAPSASAAVRRRAVQARSRLPGRTTQARTPKTGIVDPWAEDDSAESTAPDPSRSAPGAAPPQLPAPGL